MKDYKIIETLIKIYDDKLIEKIFLLSVETVKYFISYTKNFKKFKPKDIVVVRYTNWKKREFETKSNENPIKIQITNSYHDLDSVDDLEAKNRYHGILTKELAKNEEIAGLVLKTWQGETTTYYPSYFVSPSIISKYCGMAVLSGDSIFIIYDNDWARGVEVTKPPIKPTSFLRKFKLF